MKNAIFTIVAVAVGLFMVDRIGGKVMAYLTANSNTVTVGRIAHAVYKTDADVLILGSSRAQHHYVSVILEDSLGMSVYNAGIDGAEGIQVQLPLLQIILERYTPRMVVLEVSEGDFNSTNKTNNIVSLLAPYYGLSEAADTIFAHYGKSIPYEISHLYRYTSNSWNNVIGVIKSIPRDFSAKGYDPIDNIIANTDLKGQLAVSQENLEKLDMLQSFINVCKDRGITLVLCNSPKYLKVDSNYFVYLSEIAKRNQIPYLDYHTAGLFWNNPELFSDDSHLNDTGAKMFTAIVAHYLKEL